MPHSSLDSDSTQLSFKRKTWIVAAIFTLVVLLVLLFKTLFSVLLLMLAGILFAIYFHGFAHLLRRFTGAGQKWSLAFSIIINLLLLVGFFWFVGYRLQSQVASLTETLPGMIDNAKSRLGNNSLGNKVLNYLEGSGNKQKLASMAKRFFSSSFGILSDIYIILLLGIFFTASPSIYPKGLVRLIPPGAKKQAEALLHEIHTVLSNWLKGQIFGFAFIGVLTGLGLWIVGMPLVLTLALIAGLLNFIPNFGPLIALVPAGLIALMQGTNTAWWVIGIYTFIQIIQSAVTQPLIQQKMVNIPPALIVFGQVALGLLAGFWGVLLATPVIAIIMTIVNRLYVQKQKDQLYPVADK